MLLLCLAAISLPTSVAVISFVALALLLLFVLGGLFAPELKYTIAESDSAPNDSEEFAFYLEALTDAKANPESAFEVLTDGPQFYEAELAGIAQARSSINARSVHLSSRRDRAALSGCPCRTRTRRVPG